MIKGINHKEREKEKRSRRYRRNGIESDPLIAGSKGRGRGKGGLRGEMIRYRRRNVVIMELQGILQ